MSRNFNNNKSFLSIIFAFLFINTAFAQELDFEYVPFDEGLSKKTVLCILQDSRGFMWFGTLNGLYRYDGYRFTQYKHDLSDTTSLSDDNIYTLFEDGKGRLWIATNDGGLNRYKRGTESFIHYRHNPTDPYSISNDRIYSICEDKAGMIWIGTGRGGLNKFDPDLGKFRHYKHNPENPNSLTHNDVRHLLADSVGCIWIGTQHGGVDYFDPRTELFRHYQHIPGDNNSLYSNGISKLYQDRSGKIWICTSQGINIFNPQANKITRFMKKSGQSLIDNKHVVLSIYEDRSGRFWLGSDIGLYRYDPSTQDINLYTHNPLNPQSLSYNCIISICEDRSGILWFGSWEGGLNKHNPETSRFGHVKHNPEKKNSLSDNRVNVIFRDREDYIWIGTEGGALNKLNPDYSANGEMFIGQYRPQPRADHGLGYCSISAICQDHNGLMWIGTTEDGLGQYNPKTNRFSWFETKNFTLNLKHVRAIFNDHTGTIWMGSTSGGVFYYNPRTELLDNIRYDKENELSLSANLVSAIYEDQTGLMWIGTDYGLNRLRLTNEFGVDRKIVEIKHYIPEASNQYSLSNNDVNVIYQDSKSRLWIGTDCGLNLLHRDQENFIHYLEKDGLPSNLISGILEDGDGYLWISTGKGITRFDPETSQFRNYDMSDGLQGNEFEKGAFCQAVDGKMYFGGVNGFNHFYPHHIQDNLAAPPVIISDFKVLNKSVDIGEEIDGIMVLSKSITETDKIELSYKSRVFSFEFSALDFRSPNKNQYAYMLEGFEDEWNYSADRRFATYTNLDGGNYIFRSKAANKDGVWNEEGVALKIKIHPPWWETTWAYLFYIFSLIGLIYAGLRFQSYREGLKKEVALNQMEAEKLHELDQMKSRFFANISHEFRTPLTLILGSAKRLLSGEVKKDHESQYRIQIRSGKRLLKLVSELLDLSKLEAGKLILQARKSDLVPLVKWIVNSFHSYTIEHEIKLGFITEMESAVLYYDADKMEKIITNLVSNAVKYTQPGGRIDITLNTVPREDKQEMIRLTVSDTGIGIPEDRLPHIFDRFYQAGNNFVKEQQGTGIGLALTKELVKLHRGWITVQSQVEKGTIFTVLLPMGKDHLKPNEIDNTPQEDLPESLEENIIDFDATCTELSAEFVKNEKGQDPDPRIILIVEDNTDMRAYIRDVLSGEFQVAEAADGEEGFNKAAEIIPELIVSDVMMPKMDGYQLCDKLKKDERTSHIPVVMLTAKSTGEDKIEGLELGADDYLVKPFDSTELRVRVCNLIEQRKKLRERFSKEITLQPSEIAVTPTDEAFLQRAISIIENKIDDPDINIEWFSSEMGLSRSQLHRKFQAITNQSASEFIRSIRLKRALRLLEKKAATISEIAYQVGFSSPDYFRKCFREQFGIPPSEYNITD